MQKGGITEIGVSDDDGETEEGNGPVKKKGKGALGQVIAVKHGGMDAFVDRAMSEEELNRVNVRLLR
ncbi:hypothetical protein H0H92_001799, partial [Tricholoma furcatifolium]